MNTIKIAPSILSADFARMGEAATLMRACGADLLHCDVMDGMFVPNITFGPKMIADLKKAADLPLDVHLMVVRPERYVERFIESGADYVTIHAEATDRLNATLGEISRAGCKCGVVLNPDTPPQRVFDVLPLCDMVLLMSVNPGFGGQKFLRPVLDKLRIMRRAIAETGKAIELEIDGGITLENVREVRDAGANVIVAGSAVFSSADPAKTIRELRG